MEINASLKVLRNTPEVCANHYAGIAELKTVDMGATINADPVEAAEKVLGVSVTELEKLQRKKEKAKK